MVKTIPKRKEMVEAQGEQSRHSREQLIASLLAQRRMPDQGWDDLTIEMLLAELSSMDTNNFLGYKLSSYVIVVGTFQYIYEFTYLRIDSSSYLRIQICRHDCL